MDTKKKSRRAPSRLSIVTASVSSWKTAMKYISDAEEDILMLQETKASDAQVDSFRNAARKKGYILRSHGATGTACARSSGVLIAWNRSLEVTPETGMPSNDRTVSVSIKTRATGRVTLTTMYLPPGNALAQDSTGSEVLHSVLAKATDTGERLLVGGDFNTIP